MAKIKSSNVPLGLLIRLGLKEVTQNKKWALIFVLHLFWGFLGLSLVGTIRLALDEATTSQSKSFLGADLAVRSRHPISTEKFEKIKAIIQKNSPNFSVQETMFFYSMINSNTGPKSIPTKQDRKAPLKGSASEVEDFLLPTDSNSAVKSRLVQLKVLEDSPYYGHIQLAKAQPNIKSPVGTPAMGDSVDRLNRLPEVWVFPELLVQLNKQIGETIKIGEQKFTISHTVLDDSSQSLSFASLAPRIYMGRNQLAATELIQAGSTVTYLKLFKLSSKTDPAKVKVELNSLVDETGMQVLTHKEAGQRAARFLSYLSDYLGLVALVALFLSIIGLFYLIRNQLMAQEKSMAILKSLGLKSSHIQIIFISQLAFLGFTSGLITNLLAVGITPFLSQWITEFSPFQLHLQQRLFQPEILILSLLGGPLIAWPFLFSLRKIQAKSLFSEHLQWNLPKTLKNLVAFLPLGLLFYFLSVQQAHSWKIGSLFFFGLLAAGLLLTLLGNWTLKALDQRWPERPIAFKWALRFLVRNRLTTILCFLALSLGVLLLSLIHQVEGSLQNQLNPTTSALPNLFLFDIQEDQVDTLTQLLAQEGLSNVSFSPMVRARLIAINGKGFEATSDKQSSFDSREEELARRFKSRGINLNYRSKLAASERIVAGKRFDGPFKGELPEWPNPKGLPWPELSLEAGFAKSLKLKLGDLLGFDVQGVPVTGEITSLRKVQWSSFQPNFFIQFQPGVLEMAPKVFVAAISGLSPPKKDQNASSSSRANTDSVNRKFFLNSKIQIKIVDQLPNISIVDVDRFVGKIVGLLKGMTWALMFMASLALFTGLFVLYSINTYQIKTLRRGEIILLKTLGASFKNIRRMILWEMFLLSGLAAVAGTGLSLLAAAQLTQAMFDQPLNIVWTDTIGFIVVATLVALFAGLAAARPVLNSTANSK